MRRLGVREKSDERILGSGEFVERLIKQSDQTRKEQFSVHERLQRTVSHIDNICMKANISVEALRSGSRRQKVSAVRSQLAKKLVKGWGLQMHFSAMPAHTLEECNLTQLIFFLGEFGQCYSWCTCSLNSPHYKIGIDPP